nr:hypothetical protein [Tanacetum cinerariifolium]
MEEFIAHSVPAAVQESVFTKVIQEVKKHAPSLVFDVVTDTIRPRLHKVVSHVLRTEMTTNPELSDDDVNTALYIALAKSIKQDKQMIPIDSCKTTNLKKRTHDDQDDHDNRKVEKRNKKSRYLQEMIKTYLKQVIMENNRLLLERHMNIQDGLRRHAEYTKYTWVTRSDAEDRFNEVVNTYPD